MFGEEGCICDECLDLRLGRTFALSECAKSLLCDCGLTTLGLILQWEV